MRISDWLRFTIALTFACGAALAFIAYISNGIVVGDLIGVPGREHDIAIAHDRAILNVTGFSVLQLGVAGAMFTGLRIGRESSVGARFVAPALSAILLSFPVTMCCGVLIVLVLKLTR